MVVYSIESAETGATGTSGTTGRGAEAGAGADAVEVVAVFAGAVVAVAADFGAVTAVFGLMRFGKSFGATAAHNHRNAIEIRTAMKIRFSISGNGVPTSRVEHMTSREPAQAQPPAPHDSVFLDRFHHVHRAGRLEAAHRWQHRRHESLVAAEQGDGDGAHRSRFSALLLRRSCARSVRDRCCSRESRRRRR